MFIGEKEYHEYKDKDDGGKRGGEIGEEEKMNR